MARTPASTAPPVSRGRPAHARASLSPRETGVLFGLGGALVAMFAASLWFGSTTVPLSRVIEAIVDPASADAGTLVVRSVRLPRSLTAALAGAALGIAGLQMQTLFRNPLADPFVLGISSGASLGVALVVLGSGMGLATAFGASTGLVGDTLLIAAALAGALAVLAIVVAVSARVSNPSTVLILGLMVGYTATAIVTVLVSMSAPERLMELARWGFGSFSGVTWERLWLFAPVTLAGLTLAGATIKPLNALLLGEDYARSMGVAVRRARALTMAGASILSAVVTAFCGPIAFLGIAVPHVCRGLLGTSDHRALVPAVAMCGAIAAIGAQLAALLPGSAGVLPLNAVTSIVGAPIVVAILLRSRRGAFAG